jgi:hypothetical protein
MVPRGEVSLLEVRYEVFPGPMTKLSLYGSGYKGLLISSHYLNPSYYGNHVTEYLSQAYKAMLSL